MAAVSNNHGERREHRDVVRELRKLTRKENLTTEILFILYILSKCRSLRSLELNVSKIQLILSNLTSYPVNPACPA
jgi:hypothetical protein